MSRPFSLFGVSDIGLGTLARYLTKGLSVFFLVLSPCWGEECIILGQDIDSPNDNLKVAS